MEPYNTTVGQLRKGQVIRYCGVTSEVAGVRRQKDGRVKVALLRPGKALEVLWPSTLVVTKVTGSSLKRFKEDGL
jgi:hypothetical protein